MPPLYERHQETLTVRAIVRAYETTYQAVHKTAPECEHLSGNWFMVNGTRRDRRWLMLEVEYLRQKLIADAVANSTAYTGDKRKAITQVLHILASVG